MTEQLLTTRKLSPATIALLQRWINLHRVLWILALACFFVAWNRGLALLYGLFSLLFALLLISSVLPRLQLRGIQVQRFLIGNLTAGREGRIGYRLWAPHSRYHVELADPLPFAGAHDNEHLFFAEVGSPVAGELRVHCERRGCFVLDRLLLESAYPFGIIKYRRSVAVAPLEVLVLPRVVELNRLPVPCVADSTTLGDILISQQGGRDEFAAVREYSHGDELSRVHWMASARYQNLVVKEYERTDRPALLVALDCRPGFNVGEGARSTFEYAISVAASMITFATREGIQCFLVAGDEVRHEILVPAYSSDLYSLYEWLARLESRGTESSANLIEQAHCRFPQANLVAGFRLDSDSERPRLPPHVTFIDLELYEKSFRMPLHRASKPRSRRDGTRLTFSVSANMALETLFQ